MIFGEMHRGSSQGYADQLIALSEDGCITNIFPADITAHWRNEQVTLIQHTLWNTVESKSDHNPTTDADPQLLITAWARIDNRAELGAKLAIHASDSSVPDSNFILQAYKKWGENCVDHLIGDFTFVIYDLREQKLFCARDHMGVRPFYYHLSEEGFVFSSSVALFHQLDGFELEPSQQWIAEFIVDLSMSFDTTPYANIMKLPPAHCLTVSTDSSQLRQYFHFSPESTLHLENSQGYVDAYREVLEESIRCRLRSDYPIGTELSGGIDSSTIAAFAARMLSDAPSRLYAFAFSCYEKEHEYIQAVSHVCPEMATHEFHGPIEVPHASLLDHSLQVLGYPAEVEFSYEQEPFYRKAEDLGIRSILSGFGGDEFVTTQGGLARIELLVAKEFKQLYRTTQGNPMARLARLLKLALHWQHIKNRKYEPNYFAAYIHHWQNQPLRSEWVKKFNLHQRYIDISTFDSGYSNLNQFILEKCWTPFVTTRMENCSMMAASRKLEASWPLLDVRLINLFLSIPASEKHANGISRFLHRRAINGIVPDKVTWKKSKDMGNFNKQTPIIAPDTPLQNIHPDLLKMIDIEKVHTQLKTILSQTSDLQSNDLIDFIEIAGQLKHLNQWLQKSTGYCHHK